MEFGSPFDQCRPIAAAFGTCPYQLRDLRVVVMQAAEDRRGDDRSAGFDQPACGRILAQCEVRAGFVVVGGIGAQDVAEVPLAEDQHMVQAFAPHRGDQLLHMPVLPR